MTTSLQHSPFWLLGASVRDNRRRIVELAEEKSLDLDGETIQRARADLTHPRTRFISEIAWFPGVSPNKAMDLMQLLADHPLNVRAIVDLPSLARANLLAAAFERVDGNTPAVNLADFILELAEQAEQIKLEKVLRDVNEDRAVSGFPEVKDTELAEGDLAERKREYRNTIKAKLNELSSSLLVEIMTISVSKATESGYHHAPQLVDELVDSYELEIQGFLQAETENVLKLIHAMQGVAKAGPSVLNPLIDKLEKVVANWNKVTLPIQLSAKARGTQHEASRNLAYAIRGLSIELFNQHNLINQTQRLTGILQDHFLNIPDVSEKLEQDVDTLHNIVKEREAALVQDQEWAESIKYHAKIGLFFKNVLAISKDDVEWKGQRYPLNAITRVRWGGVRNSSGAYYTIGFGDHQSEAVVTTEQSKIYDAFTERLWRAVGVRIGVNMVQALAEGETIRFGDAVLADHGVTLLKHKFATDEPVFCEWSQVTVWSQNGSFVIGATDDKKTYVELPYIKVANVHILEQCIRAAFNKGLDRLSDIFKD